MNADVERLEAERLRPSPPDLGINDLLRELIHALNLAFTTPPDAGRTT